MVESPKTGGAIPPQQASEILRIRDGSDVRLKEDIARMIALSKARALELGVPLRCIFTQQRVLVCEIKPNSIPRSGELIESPHFFQNDCGVSFVPRGAKGEQTTLYSCIFLPGQFAIFCRDVLIANGIVRWEE